VNGLARNRTMLYKGSVSGINKCGRNSLNKWQSLI
jgi:hypothetical protein